MTEMRVGMAALPASKVFKVVKVLNDLKVICGQSRPAVSPDFHILLYTNSLCINCTFLISNF